MKEILLIGCGHMGGALLTTWLKSKKYSISVLDPIKYNILKKKYKNKNVKFINSFSVLERHSKYDFIILATKPNDLNKLLDQLSNIKFKKQTSLISVIAGKKLKVFEEKFNNINNIFRVMPNMPALIGEGMNCIVSNKTASMSKKNQVIKLLNYSGRTIIFQDEKQIDMATAVSGSGPGFVFNIVDAMEQAAISLGFSKNIAKILVAETFKGSIHLLQKNNISAKDLVKTVATKGGTTEAGIKIMKKNKIHQIFIKLIKASYKKAKEQGK